MISVTGKNAVAGDFYLYDNELARCATDGLNSDDFRIFVNADNEVLYVYRSDKVRLLPAEAQSFTWRPGPYDISDVLLQLAPNQRLKIRPNGAGKVLIGGVLEYEFQDVADLRSYFSL